MARLIDADALLESICQDECERSYKDCDYTCSSAQPVVNAPSIEAVPLKPLAKWMAKYAYCYGLSIYTDPKITEKKRQTTLAEAWEEAFRGMKWEDTND